MSCANRPAAGPALGAQAVLRVSLPALVEKQHGPASIEDAPAWFWYVAMHRRQWERRMESRIPKMRQSSYRRVPMRVRAPSSDARCKRIHLVWTHRAPRHLHRPSPGVRRKSAAEPGDPLPRLGAIFRQHRSVFGTVSSCRPDAKIFGLAMFGVFKGVFAGTVPAGRLRPRRWRTSCSPGSRGAVCRSPPAGRS